MIEKGIRKEFDGLVISNKMTKTIVVQTSRRVSHEEYTKVITLKRKFYAHDEKSEAKVGDTVRIRESRPLSRLKRWTLVEVLVKGDESTLPVERTRVRKRDEAKRAQGGSK